MKNLCAAALLLVCGLSAQTSAPADAHNGSGWWRGQRVSFQRINGTAVTQGDILLENVSGVEPPATSKAATKDALVRNNARFLWPDLTIPYVIDPGLQTPQRVRDAISHWSSNTPFRFVERSSELNYVRFQNGDGCNSFVGMIGREQAVNLASTCSVGATIHEIGHAVGLFHEQSRNDRDLWMQLLGSNADARALDQFDQAFSSGQDSGGFDYSSIMQYGITDFSRNGLPVLRSIPAGIPIGQRDGLSPADVAGVKKLYGITGTETVVNTYPAGLDIIVDGERFKAPRSFAWDPGSTHTLAVPEPQTVDTYRFLFGRWSNDGTVTQTITASPETPVFTAAFVRQYQIPLAVGSGRGRLEITRQSADGWYPDGTVLTVRAVPDPGWNFLGWGGFGQFGAHGISPNPLRVVVRGPQTRYSASFTQAPLTTVTSNPPNLQVVVDGQTITTPQSYAWAAGSTHTLAVRSSSQNSGNDTARHRFSGWNNTGDASQTITVGDPATYTAQFDTDYNVYVSQSSGGRIDITPAGNADDFWPAGSTLTLRSTPTGTNRLVGWGGNAGGTGDLAALTVDGQKSVSASFAPPNQIAAGGLVNAASFAYGNGVAPGSLVTIFGSDIGPESLAYMSVANGRVTTDLSGYRVTFDEYNAPLVYVTKNQVSAIVPWGIAGREQTVVRVAGPGFVSGGRIVPVIASNPGIFTMNSSGSGPAAALNQDYSVNTARTPARQGSVVMLYATGGGTMNPPVIDGQVISSSTLPSLQLPVRVRVNGIPAKVLYAGAAPQSVAGIVQVNIELPSGTPSGEVPVSLAIGPAANAGNVTIFVE